MNVLFIRYNKVTNQAFDTMLSKCPASIKAQLINLSPVNHGIDTFDYNTISRCLSAYEPFDAVVVGDIYWPTGQHICTYCEEHQKVSHFLQHGQWVFIDNKKNPKHCASVTHVNGSFTHAMVSSWPYALKSKIEITGNPRYDDVLSEDGDAIYFAPPVVKELSPSAPPRINNVASRTLVKLRGLDTKFKVMLHPHYREGDIEFFRKVFPHADFINPMDDPFIYISKCSKVLTHRNSTTVLDAIAHRKISVLINFDAADEPLVSMSSSLGSFFSRNHFGIFALESSSPATCLSNLSADFPAWPDNYEEQAKRYIWLGNASERLFCSIMKHEPSTNSDL